MQSGKGRESDRPDSPSRLRAREALLNLHKGRNSPENSGTMEVDPSNSTDSLSFNAGRVGSMTNQAIAYEMVSPAHYHSKLESLLADPRFPEAAEPLEYLMTIVSYYGANLPMMPALNGEWKIISGILYTLLNGANPTHLDITYARSFVSDCLSNRNQQHSGTKRANPEENSVEEASSKDDFIIPKKTAKRTEFVEITPPLPTQNQYDSLPEEKIDDPSASTETETPKEKTPRPVKPEPFHIKMVDGWRDHVNEMFRLIETQLPLKVLGDFVRVTPKTIEQFRTIQKYLMDKKLQCYGLNLRGERPKKILVKGIPKEVPAELVKKFLTDLGHNVSRVTQLRKYDSELQAKRPLPSYLCHLHVVDEDWEKIYDISVLDGFDVKITSFQSKGPKQCYNCQKFNHSSEICSLDPVCMKCAGPHKTYDCQKPKTLPAKCANCKQDHPSNYRSCPMNPDQIRARRSQNNPKSPTIQNPTPAPAQPTTSQSQIPPTIQNHRSWSSVAATGLKNKNPSPNGTNSPPQPQLLITSPPLPDLDSTIEKLEKIAQTLERIVASCDRLQIPSLSQYLNMLASAPALSTPLNNTATSVALPGNPTPQP